MKIITPGKKFERLSKYMEVAIERALDQAAEDIAEQLESPTRTWRHKADFYILSRRGERQIVTDDKAYFFVTRGTRVRYAVMTPGFIPKTQRRMMVSGPGAGGVAFIGKKPLPGIEAREFEEEARDIEQRQIERTFHDEIQAALDAFNKGMI